MTGNPGDGQVVGAQQIANLSGTGASPDSLDGVINAAPGSAATVAHIPGGKGEIARAVRSYLDVRNDVWQQGQFWRGVRKRLDIESEDDKLMLVKSGEIAPWLDPLIETVVSIEYIQQMGKRKLFFGYPDGITQEVLQPALAAGYPKLFETDLPEKMGFESGAKDNKIWMINVLSYIPEFAVITKMKQMTIDWLIADPYLALMAINPALRPFLAGCVKEAEKEGKFDRKTFMQQISPYDLGIMMKERMTLHHVAAHGISVGEPDIAKYINALSALPERLK